MGTKTWTDFEGRVYDYADDKLDFDSWLEANSNIKEAWFADAKKFEEWHKANPGSPGEDYHGECAQIFNQWLLYSSGVQR